MSRLLGVEGDLLVPAVAEPFTRPADQLRHLAPREVLLEVVRDLLMQVTRELFAQQRVEELHEQVEREPRVPGRLADEAAQILEGQRIPALRISR